MLDNSILVLSANCQGLRDSKKRADVINYFKETNANIICLQDTHLVTSDIKDFHNVWEDEFYIHGHKTNSRGVAMLFRKNFDFIVTDVTRDTEGNLLQLQFETFNMKINSLNIYGPNSDNPSFFSTVEKAVVKSVVDYNIICGDFNLVLDPVKDCSNYKNINNPRSQKKIHEIIENCDLLDIYRLMHPNDKRFTWRRKNPFKQARLDYFLISNSMIDLVKNCTIKPSYRSDHSSLLLELRFSEF